MPRANAFATASPFTAPFVNVSSPAASFVKSCALSPVKPPNDATDTASSRVRATGWPKLFASSRDDLDTFSISASTSAMPCALNATSSESWNSSAASAPSLRPPTIPDNACDAAPPRAPPAIAPSPPSFLENPPALASAPLVSTSTFTVSVLDKLSIFLSALSTSLSLTSTLTLGFALPSLLICASASASVFLSDVSSRPILTVALFAIWLSHI